MKKHCLKLERSSHDVLRKYWDEDKIECVEQFKVLLLNWEGYYSFADEVIL